MASPSQYCKAQLSIIMQHTLHKTANRADMQFLQLLLKISYALSTAPYYDFEKKKIRKFKLYSIYSSSTLVFIIMGFLFSAASVSVNGEKESQAQQIGSLMEMLASLLLVIAALFAVSGAIFMSDKWQYFFEQLQNADIKLGFSREAAVFRKTYLKLLFLCLPKVLKDIYCIYTYTSLSPGHMPKYFICNTIFEYYCYISTLLSVSFTFIIKDDYKMVMKFLKNHRREIGLGKSKLIISEILPYSTASSSQLRSISKMFRLLNSILEHYNLIFGYQLLFMLGHTLLAVLQTFDYCLKYKKIGSDGSMHALFANLCMTAFNLVNIYLKYIFFIINFLVLQIKCSIVIICCDITTREAGKLIDICYTIEEDFPSSSAERKEVLKLVRLGRYKNPCFSAAGFFNIDRKTFFGFLNVTTTYFIIIIQFNQS